MPTLAVIIAARGAERWLDDCVASVLNQRPPDGWAVGVAVGIDACPATLATASRLRASRRLAIRYFPDHVGPYVIFNSLACTTKADTLARFDADDVMLPGYLAHQLSRLDPALDLMIAQTWSTYVDERLRPCAAPLADGSRTGPDGHRNRGSDGQFLMTRGVLDRLGGFRGWLCHADSEFLERARWSGVSRVVIERHLYLRRVHGASLTAVAETGYGSGLRTRYARAIADARRRYAAGSMPERVRPPVARYVPVGLRG